MNFIEQLCPYVIVCLAFIFVCCDESDNGINTATTGSLIIEFDSRAGDADLVLGAEYVNAAGESFKVEKLNYYISNLKLKTTDGLEHTVPQDSSYFLIIEEEEATHAVRINGVPAGDYNEITFTIGVDSLRSTMDVSRRAGVLDPAQGHDGMYWTWNSGYIFFKMEGTSPAAPADQENKFYYHIGGFGGYDTPSLNNIREKTISMGNARAEVRPDRSPEIHLHVDVLEFFGDPVTVRIAEHPVVMLSEFSETVSSNYVNMFRYDHVHN